MTASYTYNQPQRVSAEARTKVRTAAEALGYAGPDPNARSLRRGSSRTIGLVLGEQLPYAFEDPQAASFLAGVATVCASHGYGMTILPITGDPDDAMRIHDAAADGLIIWTTVEDDPVLAAITAGRRPAVVHGGPKVDGMSLVSIDNQAAAEAIGAIAFKVSRRPAVLSFPVDARRTSHVVRGPATTSAAVPFPVTRARLRGYRAAARARGHRWSDVTVAISPRNSADDAERAARALLSGPNPPDAIAAMSDQLAAGLIRAAADLGIDIPTELSVTGWDDDPIAARLDLSTVRQSLRNQGEACARILLGAAPARDEYSPWGIVERTSTRP